MSESVLEPPVKTSSNAITLHLADALRFTDDEFFLLCQINRDLRLERTAEGDIIVMPPTGFETGARNSDITMQVALWSKKDGQGVVVDSSTGFKLPNGADRSPDTAWILRSRLAAVPPEKKKKFLPLCPDFVIELKSPTDDLEATKAKMNEYIANGVRLGLLLNPETRRVHIYRPNAEVEILENPESVSCEPVLAGFTLDLREIWEPNL